MAWSDAARAAALEVRRSHARAIGRARKIAATPGGLTKLRHETQGLTRHQLASALRSARSGEHWSSPKLRSLAVKRAAAASVYKKLMGGR